MKRASLENRLHFLNERAFELEIAAQELAACAAGTWQRRNAQIVLCRRAVRYGIAVRRYIGGAND